MLYILYETSRIVHICSIVTIVREVTYIVGPRVWGVYKDRERLEEAVVQLC